MPSMKSSWHGGSSSQLIPSKLVNASSRRECILADIPAVLSGTEQQFDHASSNEGAGRVSTGGNSFSRRARPTLSI